MDEDIVCLLFHTCSTQQEVVHGRCFIWANGPFCLADLWVECEGDTTQKVQLWQDDCGTGFLLYIALWSQLNLSFKWWANIWVSWFNRYMCRNFYTLLTDVLINYCLFILWLGNNWQHSSTPSIRSVPSLVPLLPVFTPITDVQICVTFQTHQTNTVIMSLIDDSAFLLFSSPTTLLWTFLFLLIFCLVSNKFTSQEGWKEPPGPWALPLIGNLLQLDLKRPHETLCEVSLIPIKPWHHQTKTEILRY